jgi:hypothetical protein
MTDTPTEPEGAGTEVEFPPAEDPAEEPSHGDTTPSDDEEE